MKIAFILKFNKKHNAKLHSEIEKHFHTFTCSFHYSLYASHSIVLAQEAAKNSDIIVAVGGDGTINEVLNGILTSENPSVVLGVLPKGTANDFNKIVQIKSVKNLFERIKAQNYQTIDIGKVEFNTPQNQKESRYFINISDVGLGGTVMQSVNKSKKLFGASLTFLWTIAKTFSTFKKQEVEIRAEGNILYEGKLLSLVVANGKYFGSGLCIAPKADLFSGDFQTIVLGNVSIADYIKNIFNLKRGKEIRHPQVHYFNSKNIQITSKKPIPLEADGEFVGFSPCSFEIVPKKIKIIL